MNHVELLDGSVSDYFIHLGRLLLLVGRDVTLRQRHPRHQAFGHRFVGFEWVRRVERVGGLPHEEGQKGTPRTHRRSWVSGLMFPLVSP